MKKFFLFISFIALLFLISFFIFNFLKKEKKNFDLLITDFKADAIMITPEKEIQFEIFHNEETTSICISKPKNIEGFKFIWDKDGKQKISFHDLNHEFTSNVSSEHSYFNKIVNILNYIHDSSKIKKINSESENIKFLGKINDISFEIFSDKNGFIKEIIIINDNVRVITQTISNNV